MDQGPVAAPRYARGTPVRSGDPLATSINPPSKSGNGCPIDECPTVIVARNRDDIAREFPAAR
jgi:hypothetical protein